jgi:hypothetical protein
MSARRPMARPTCRLDDADHAGHAQAADDGDAPFRQLGGDHVGGALLFVAQFRMGVQVAPDLLQFGLKCNDGIYQFHAASPVFFRLLLGIENSHCSPCPRS